MTCYTFVFGMLYCTPCTNKDDDEDDDDNKARHKHNIIHSPIMRPNVKSFWMEH